MQPTIALKVVTKLSKWLKLVEFHSTVVVKLILRVLRGCRQRSQSIVGNFQHEATVNQTIARPQLSMNRDLTVVQVEHSLDDVVDQRHPEVPVQLNRDILQDFLQGFGAVFVENEDVGAR